MKMVVDRIGDGVAILIGQDDAAVRMTLPLSCLPQGSCEGDILEMTLTKDVAATAEGHERLSGQIARLKKPES